MAQFFASCPKGLVEALELELQELGFTHLEKSSAGVYFDSNWEGCYKVNLWSRVASRVMKPVLTFTAYQPEELYGQIRKHDFTKYISNKQTLFVDSVVKESKMGDQRFVAMKVKDAIVDQFRDETGDRPNIDKNSPDLRIQIKGYKNTFDVSIDTSGESLYQRGYRKEVGDAPLKENLAAGLVRLSGWDQKSALVDLMCGSGTFLIEAAMMALNIAPGLLRKGYGFQKLKNFDEETWKKLINEAIESEKEAIPFKLFGYDIDRRTISKAKANAKNAGVEHVIDFRPSPVAIVEAPVPQGTLVVNPPYGARIGDEHNLRDVYRDLSFTLKHRFKGWDCWILSGNKDLIQDLKLKSTRRHFVYNGPLECRFLKYSMF